MNFNVLTIFPEIFSVLNTGVLSKELGKSFFIDCYDIRKHAVNKHGQIDSKPYGGGEGMVMMPKPLKNSLKDIPKSKACLLYTSPSPRD